MFRPYSCHLQEVHVDYYVTKKHGFRENKLSWNLCTQEATIHLHNLTFIFKALVCNT
jgi:hypothetical protein